MRRTLSHLRLSRVFKRSLSALTRSTVRAGFKALVKKQTPVAARLRTGFVAGLAGGLQYRLFVPASLQRGECLPLLVMLHGCGQDAQAIAASTRMNAIAERERFVVLYPEQSRMANLQGCWNWFQTRTGKAQNEADTILVAIDQICRTQAVDPQRIVLAGFSAGAGMAALLATRYPERFRAVAMHSGVAPGLAHSTASALSAMHGMGAGLPLAERVGTGHLPALLVIQGRADALVAPANGAKAAQLWAANEQAKPGTPRALQRGARYAHTVTDYYTHARLVVTLCEIGGLGHAWSGGAASQAYSDPKGPDASRMIWTFAAKQFGTPRMQRNATPKRGAQLLQAAG